MDNEKIERQMAFIIDQQAKFSVDIEKFRENLERVDIQIENNAKQIERNTQNIEVNRQHILQLTDALMTLTKFAQQHEGQLVDLAKQTKETDDRLNAMINFLENRMGPQN
jgi:hypothetical protein